MKNPIQFTSTKRQHDRQSSQHNSAATSRRDIGPSTAFASNGKMPFKTDIVNTELARKKSPQIKSFFEYKATPSNYGNSDQTKSMKAELNNIRKDGKKLVVNTSQPLQFKQKNRNDRSDPATRPTLTSQNRQCSFNLQYRPMLPNKSVFDQSSQTRRDNDRLKFLLQQKDQQIIELNKKIMRIQGQLAQNSKDREQLESDVQMVRVTSRQFKEEVDRLKEELRAAGEKEKLILTQRTNLQRLNSKRESDVQSRITQLTEAIAAEKSRIYADTANVSETWKKEKVELDRQLKLANTRILAFESEKKIIEQGHCQLIRRKEKEIGLLKQQVAILQQLTSTRAAEQNCLMLQKEAVEKMCAQKDQQTRRLQKDLSDMRERLETEKNFSASLGQKMNLKDFMIQNLQNEQESLRKQIVGLRQEVRSAKQNSGTQTATFNTLAESLQKSQTDRIKLQLQSKSSEAQLRRLRSVQKLLGEKTRQLESQLEKAKLKEKSIIEEGKVNKIRENSSLQQIKALQDQLQKVRLSQRSTLQELCSVKQRELSVLDQLRVAQSQNQQVKLSQRNSKLALQAINLQLQQKNQIIIKLSQQNNSLKCNDFQMKTEGNKIQQQLKICHLQINRMRDVEKLLLEENRNLKCKEVAGLQELNALRCRSEQLRLSEKYAEKIAEELNTLRKQYQATVDELRINQLHLEQSKALEKGAMQTAKDTKSRNSILLEEIVKLRNQLQPLSNQGAVQQQLRSEIANLKSVNEVLTKKLAQAEANKVRQIQIANLRSANQTLLAKLQQLETNIKSQKTNTVHHNSTPQEQPLREELARKDQMIGQIRGSVGKLQNLLHQAEGRLQRTEYLLVEANDTIARLRLRQLSQKLQSTIF